MWLSTYDIKEPGVASEIDIKKYIKEQDSEIKKVRKKLISYTTGFPDRQLPIALAQALSYTDYLLGIMDKRPELGPAAVNLLDGIGSCKSPGEAGFIGGVFYLSRQKSDIFECVCHMLDKERGSLSPEDASRLQEKRKEFLEHMIITDSLNQPTNTI
jgi:hypothetical protein